ASTCSQTDSSNTAPSRSRSCCAGTRSSAEPPSRNDSRGHGLASTIRERPPTGGKIERGGDMTSLAGALLAEAQRLVEPLVVAERVDSGAEMLLGLVGQSADAAGDPGLAAALTDLAKAASALTALQDTDLDSWSGLEAVADAARKATTALAAL